MARTTIEIPLKYDIDYTLQVIHNIFAKHGYENKTVKDEDVWIKGDGFITVMHCFGYSFTDSSLILQGWTRSAMLGEASLEGFGGYLDKKIMKSIMKEIEQSI